MTDLRYSTGTCSVDKDSGVVSFSSAQMLQHAMTGDQISINRNPDVDIVTVDGQLQVTIDPWPYDSVSNVPYILKANSILRATRGQVAADVSKLNASLNKSGYYYYVGDDQGAPDPSDGDDGQWAQQESTGKRWLKTGGEWIFKGVFRMLDLQGNWDAETDYTLGQVTTRKGKLWYSLVDGNLDNIPESSPTQWEIFLSGGDAYDIANFDTDRPATGEDVLEFCVTKVITFYAGMADSRARAKVGATNASFYSFRKNDVEFARMSFAAGGQGGSQLGTFTCAADTSFDPASNDYLSIIAPATRDPTLSGIAWTIAAYRNN